MRKFFTLLFMSVVIVSNAQHVTIKLFDEVLFYDGYNSLTNLANEIVPVPDNIIRLKTSVCATKLSEEQLNSFGDSIAMNIIIKAACDNYDRIGKVNLAFVPKGVSTYNTDSVTKIELGRFITPFMNKNRNPTEVPYVFEVNHLKYVFTNETYRELYDYWVELDVFGVPYAANTQITGCSGRSDVFYGTMEFVTNQPSLPSTSESVLVPLFSSVDINNYNVNATDTLGKTVRSATFTTIDDLYDAKLVLVTSNHGANAGGEEYNRRWHYVYFDGTNVLTYKPGRTSCEPFRQYNTQSNGIYTSFPRTDTNWQSFSNWCPGDVIDNRVIQLNHLTAGEHTFKIEVPDAEFVNNEGYIPLSLFMVGSTNISAKNNEESFSFMQIYPNPTTSTLHIKSNLTVKKMDVYNSTGQVVKSFNNASGDIANLSNGVYLVQVEFENGQLSTQKIMKK